VTINHTHVRRVILSAHARDLRWERFDAAAGRVVEGCWALASSILLPFCLLGFLLIPPGRKF
jgi:hypothetical protein